MIRRRTDDGVTFRGGITFGFALLLLVGAGTNRADAAPIRSNPLLPATTANLGPRWSRFLAGGPSLWSRVGPPPFRSFLTLPRVDGQLVASPFLDYLLWRRELNPGRFDYYHPNVARELAAVLRPTPTIQPTIASTPTPRTPPTVNPQPQTVVPEPQTLAIGLVLMAGAFGWHRRRQANGAEGR